MVYFLCIKGTGLLEDTSYRDTQGKNEKIKTLMIELEVSINNTALDS